MNYHFPRTEFAEKIIKALSEFDDATIFSFMLYEEKGKGKTTFLLKDIKSLAENKFHVFYFSFIGKGEGVIEKFKQCLGQFFKKVVCSQKQELLEVTKKSEEMELQDLREIFQMIKTHSRKPILFLFDEFQEVGKASKGEGFIKTLRTVLDQDRECFKSIFTGSSLYDIGAMFNHYSQPFYKFGVQISLPLLPDEFIADICNQFEQKQGVCLNNAELLSIFNKYERTPLIIIEIIRDLTFYGKEYQFDVNVAYERIKNKVTKVNNLL